MKFKNLLMISFVSFFISGEALAIDWRQLGFALGCTFRKKDFACPKSDHGKDIMWEKVWMLKNASNSDLTNIKNSKDAPQYVRDAASYELSKRAEKPAPKPRTEVRNPQNSNTNPLQE
jgi:hypothetical protein